MVLSVTWILQESMFCKAFIVLSSLRLSTYVDGVVLMLFDPLGPPRTTFLRRRSHVVVECRICWTIVKAWAWNSGTVTCNKNECVSQ